MLKCVSFSGAGARLRGLLFLWFYAFSRRVRRPAERAIMLNQGGGALYIHFVMMPLVQGRVRALDVACSADVPGSRGNVQTKA